MYDICGVRLDREDGTLTADNLLDAARAVLRRAELLGAPERSMLSQTVAPVLNEMSWLLANNAGNVNDIEQAVRLLDADLIGNRLAAFEWTRIAKESARQAATANRS